LLLRPPPKDLVNRLVVREHLPFDNTAVADSPASRLRELVNRCFQILQSRCEDSWRSETDLVIAPDVRGVDWHGFGLGPQLIQAGEAAALAALSKIQEWFSRIQPGAAPAAFLPAASLLIRRREIPLFLARSMPGALRPSGRVGSTGG
jgi:hypothetical protein